MNFPCQKTFELNSVVLDVFLAIFQDLCSPWLHYGRGELKTDYENEFPVPKKSPGDEFCCLRCLLCNFSTCLPLVAPLWSGWENNWPQKWIPFTRKPLRRWLIACFCNISNYNETPPKRSSRCTKIDFLQGVYSVTLKWLRHNFEF